MELDRNKDLGANPTDSTLGPARSDADLGMTTPTTGTTHTPLADERDAGRSNFMAYLIGGLVIAVGLMAFLFYDGGTRDVNTTSSTRAPIQTPASPSAPSTTAPATPTAPAR